LERLTAKKGTYSIFVSKKWCGKTSKSELTLTGDTVRLTTELSLRKRTLSMTLLSEKEM